MHHTQSSSISPANDSLEKSLQSLRGKLSGFRNEQNSIARGLPLKDMDRNNQYAKTRFTNGNNPKPHVGQTDKDTEYANANAKLKSNAHVSHMRYPKRFTNQNFQPLDSRGEQNTEQSIRSSGNRVAFALASDSEKNLFDEFRNKVYEIRESRQKPSSRLDDARVRNLKPIKQAQDQLSVPKSSESRRPGEARQILMSKIEQQNEEIEALRLESAELRAVNAALNDENSNLRSTLENAQKDHEQQEKVYRQAISELKSRKMSASRAADQRSARLSYLDQEKLSEERSARLDLETKLIESREENAELRRRVNEIAERAQFLNSIQEQRIKTLEEKLKVSTGVAKFYCDSMNDKWESSLNESTDEILFGPQDQTTMNLLKDMTEYNESKKSNGPKSLRKYFLAVLFMVRLKNETRAQRLWNSYAS